MSTPFPGYFMERDRLTVNKPFTGVQMQLGWGEKMMLSRVTIEPGSAIPEHSHPHEQAGVCLEGSFELTIAGESRVVRAGDLYLIPGDVKHSVRGLDEPAVALDVFAPPREDYLPTTG